MVEAVGGTLQVRIEVQWLLPCLKDEEAIFILRYVGIQLQERKDFSVRGLKLGMFQIVVIPYSSQRMRRAMSRVPSPYTIA